MDLKKAQELFSLKKEECPCSTRDKILNSSITMQAWTISSQEKIPRINKIIILIKLPSQIKVWINYNNPTNLMSIKEISLHRTNFMLEEQVSMHQNRNKTFHWTTKDKVFTKTDLNLYWIIIILCNSLGITKKVSPWIWKWLKTWFSTGPCKVRPQEPWRVSCWTLIKICHLMKFPLIFWEVTTNDRKF